MNRTSRQLGKRTWAFAAGHIPLTSTGPEPEFTSHDNIAVLNTGDRDAEIELNIYFSEQTPMNGYKLKVKAGRVRKFRLNDLIDPLPIPLDTPYSFVLQSQVPVLVQFSRTTTGCRNNAGFCTTPYSIKNL